MFIKEELCIGCQKCMKFCPVGAIRTREGSRKPYIEFNDCVECGSCLRMAKCPRNAIENNPETFQEPRIQRKAFSDPQFNHPSVNFPGRGTEEVKTNDVSGVVRRGELAFGMEMGRPGTGTTMKDVAYVVHELAKIGIQLPKHNALYYLFSDVEHGIVNPIYVNEKFLSAIIEFTVPMAKVPEVLSLINRVSGEIDTVFSLDAFGRFDDDGETLPWLKVLEEYGIKPNPHAKVNLGMGRPLVTD